MRRRRVIGRPRVRPTLQSENRSLMKPRVRNFAIAAVAAIAFAPAGARAQWYSSYPQRAAVPYGAQQPYAVEVSPRRYVIHHPTVVRRLDVRASAERARARVDNDRASIAASRQRRHVRRDAKNRVKNHVKHRIPDKVVQDKVKVVRDKPIVVVHRRVVDDPPRVILREHVVTDLPRGHGLFQLFPQQVVEDLPPVVEPATARPPSWRHEYRHVEVREPHRTWRHKPVRRVESRKAIVRGGLGSRHTIHAEAEVTILGPDRMTIRLFRKGSAAKAEAPTH
jgi:hypothetical protein